MLMSVANLPHESVPKWAPTKRPTSRCAAGARRARVRLHAARPCRPGRAAGAGPTGARLSGLRFSFLRGPAARLHRALAQFMLDPQTGNGLHRSAAPHIVNREILEGTGQLPKFKEDMFWVPRKRGGRRKSRPSST